MAKTKRPKEENNSELVSFRTTICQKKQIKDFAKAEMLTEAQAMRRIVDHYFKAESTINDFLYKKL